MATILELLTVNIAVDDLNSAVPRYEGLGLQHVEPEVMPDPPVQITDVSFPLSRGGAFSLITPTDPASTVARFLDRRGPGLYSIAVRVDDLQEAMHEWSSRGLEWVLDQPLVTDDGKAVQYRVEKLLLNWVKPKTFGGVLLEVFEFQGKVDDWG